jgi:hypothetical protein
LAALLRRVNRGPGQSLPSSSSSSFSLSISPSQLPPSLGNLGDEPDY